MVYETERLYMREMTQDDFPFLCRILQDKRVMYAYAHAFSHTEVQDWMDKQLFRYKTYGYGLWAVVQKGETDKMIGQCGLTLQDWNGKQVPEIGYLLQYDYWHQGYAAEAAKGCKQYAFEALGFSEVFSIIRDNNFASIRVAKRNGMKKCGAFTKHYYQIDMPHVVYGVKKEPA